MGRLMRWSNDRYSDGSSVLPEPSFFIGEGGLTASHTLCTRRDAGSTPVPHPFLRGILAPREIPRTAPNGAKEVNLMDTS